MQEREQPLREAFARYEADKWDDERVNELFAAVRAFCAAPPEREGDPVLARRANKDREAVAEALSSPRGQQPAGCDAVMIERAVLRRLFDPSAPPEAAAETREWEVGRVGQTWTATSGTGSKTVHPSPSSVECGPTQAASPPAPQPDEDLHFAPCRCSKCREILLGEKPTPEPWRVSTYPTIAELREMGDNSPITDDLREHMALPRDRPEPGISWRKYDELHRSVIGLRQGVADARAQLAEAQRDLAEADREGGFILRAYQQRAEAAERDAQSLREQVRGWADDVHDLKWQQDFAPYETLEAEMRAAAGAPPEVRE